MATASRAGSSVDCGLSRTRPIMAYPLQSSRASGAVCHYSAVTTRSGVSRRGLALQATCLDQVDFGVSQTIGATLGGNAAKLLLRRNDFKDQRKRWSSSKISGDQDAASAARASTVLASKLVERQPTIARIVLRAQQVKDLNAYQGPRAQESDDGRRIRSRSA